MYRYALLSSLPTRLSSSFSFSNAKLSVMFLKKWKNISSIFVKESKLPVNFLQHCLHHCAVVLEIAGHLFLRHFSPNLSLCFAEHYLLHINFLSILPLIILSVSFLCGRRLAQQVPGSVTDCVCQWHPPTSQTNTGGGPSSIRRQRRNINDDISFILFQLWTDFLSYSNIKNKRKYSCDLNMFTYFHVFQHNNRPRSGALSGWLRQWGVAANHNCYSCVQYTFYISITCFKKRKNFTNVTFIICMIKYCVTVLLSEIMTETRTSVCLSRSDDVSVV